MHLDFCMFYVLSLLFLSAKINADKKNDSVFVPTNEWQVIKEGTPLPKGLHIRHNFQTGVTEAKLMDKTEEESSKESKSSSSLTLLPDDKQSKDDIAEDKVKPSDTLNMSLEDLKHKLKKIKYYEDNIKHKEEKKKFRSYEQLKSELGDLKLNVSTDMEILNDLFQKFDGHKEAISAGNLNSTKVEEILDVLNNLEYLIHHIDNAQLFADLRGMSKIISPCLNSTNNEVKAESLRLLGAAVQSNPKVQLIALENDYVQKLLLMITVNSKPELQSRCLFALSALVRQFPIAQKALVDHGGLEIFGKILDGSQSMVQTRVMKLVNDLIVERQEVAVIEKKDHRWKEYNAAELERKLLMHNYCRHLGNLMNRSVKNVALDNLDRSILYDDLFETTFESMLTASDICRHEFSKRSRDIFGDIDAMVAIYESNTDEVIDESIQRHFIDLLERLKKSIVIHSHDDL